MGSILHSFIVTTYHSPHMYRSDCLLLRPTNELQPMIRVLYIAIFARFISFFLVLETVDGDSSASSFC